MADRADLHMHSHCSDGRLPPEDLARIAEESGLRAASLTDHDTLLGWERFSLEAERLGLQAISGVELSSRFNKHDAHVLGYHVRPDDAEILEALDRFRRARLTRAEKMVERLNDLGVPLEFEDVARVAGEGVYGRPHVADALFHSGFVATYEDAFRRYIGAHGPAYIPKPTFLPGDAIDLIHSAGGLAVLAHPASHFAETDIRGLAVQGLDGLEIIHPRHTAETTRRLRGVAKRADLFTTGGSDFHGEGRGKAKIGNPGIPYDLVEEMSKHL